MATLKQKIIELIDQYDQRIRDLDAQIEYLYNETESARSAKLFGNEVKLQSLGKEYRYHNVSYISFDTHTNECVIYSQIHAQERRLWTYQVQGITTFLSRSVFADFEAVE